VYLINFASFSGAFQLGLLDFGATREYRPFFVNNYFKIIDGAAKGDRDQGSISRNSISAENFFGQLFWSQNFGQISTEDQQI
jgi:hypothetical protein